MGVTRTELQGAETVDSDTRREFAIETQGLSKSFGDTEALKSLNLKVPKNSIFGFLGPNGAGKTTTIKLLLGLIRPTAGAPPCSATTSPETASTSAGA